MLGVAIAFIIGGSVGVLGMGAWCGAALDRMRGQRDIAQSAHNTSYSAYATERRKRLDAEQAVTDMEAQKDRIHGLLTSLSKDHNAALVKLEQIAAIPNNGKKPNGGLLKAQRIAGA